MRLGCQVKNQLSSANNVYKAFKSSLHFNLISVKIALYPQWGTPPPDCGHLENRNCKLKFLVHKLLIKAQSKFENTCWWNLMSVCLSPTLCNNYPASFQEIWWRCESWAKEKPIKADCRSGSLSLNWQNGPFSPDGGCTLCTSVFHTQLIASTTLSMQHLYFFLDNLHVI